MAILTFPSVPFLNPTGIERPEASSRCTWLSVVRAPMAPQETVSAEELRGDGVEELAAGAHPLLGEPHQQPTREREPLVDAEAPVQVRVVDQPLPADPGPRLLEVHPHDQEERVGQPTLGSCQPLGVRPGRVDVVDRAGADDHQHPVVHPVEDGAHLAP